ncbi:murein hydrolase activator EnvC [Halobacillus sp. Marseille-Q1614]|uniref:murein hydrolase activator EnvC family protein n=1 Tax=Halobacillus sp. Marseille-Q1614 TaxID=2709134 RepID=UPI00156E9D55|nr:M23 family metallopeptidase [Halobacillus sp. Marseille-Q1614]
MRKFYTVSLTTLLVAGSLLTPFQVEANGDLDEVRKELRELEEEKGNVGDKKSKISEDKSKTEEEIAQNEAEQEKTEKQMEKIDKQLSETQEKLRQKETEIKETEEQITQLKKEIEELQKRIKEREELLTERLRALQKSGGDVQYLEVLMGAQSFGDFLDRASAVTTIMDQDKNIMDTHMKEKQLLEEKQIEVKQKKEDLVSQKADLEEIKADLDKQMAEKEKLMEELEVQEKELHDHKMDLEEEESLLKSQEAAIQSAMKNAENEESEIQAEIERQAELERQREAERKKQEAAKSSSSSSSSSASPAPAPKPAALSSGDKFIRPAAGPITSEMGARWGSNHAGMDIGGNGTPIKAAASGEVLRSYYSSSYGNVVYLTHYIDGKVYTTVYAHMQNRQVSSGDTVSQGQQLGLMGNTGQSTGPHLHFELHEGAWNASKSNAVNPRNYINF